MKISHHKQHEIKDQDIKEGNPKSKASYHYGSTTQGGSNFGQGSMHLGKKEIYKYKQGSESNKGSNYSNERGWNNEALRRHDDKPAG